MTPRMPGRSILTTTSRPVLQCRHVHLSDRRRRQGNRFETAEDVRDRPSKGPLDGGDGGFTAERRHAILQLRQFIGDVGGQQVAPRRQHLAELDEDRTQFLQRQTQPLRAGAAAAALEPGPRREVDEKAGTAGTNGWRGRNHRVHA